MSGGLLNPFLSSGGSSLVFSSISISQVAAVTSDVTSVGGCTLVNKLPISTFPVAGATKFRLTLIGPKVSGNVTVYDNVTISNVAASGDAYDSLAAPVAVTFSGSASVSLTQGQQIVSDVITTFTAGNSAILIAYNIANTADAVRRTSMTGPVRYVHLPIAEAATANRTSTGYAATADQIAGISKIEYA